MNPRLISTEQIESESYEELLSELGRKKRTLLLAQLGQLNMRPRDIVRLQDEVLALEYEQFQFLGHDW